MPTTEENHIASLLESIKLDCLGVIKDFSQKTSTPVIQQQQADKIQKQKESVLQLLEQSHVSAAVKNFFRQTLIGITYDFDKLATNQAFGITTQPQELPEDVVVLGDLILEGDAAVASANQTAKARLRHNGIRVFYKTTKPEIAQLEVVAAEFFRQTLGGSSTSHGGVVTEGKEIRGMYVEAIPGFISMRQLTDLAKHPDAYERIQAIIDELNIEIASLKLSAAQADSQKLKEKTNLCNAYMQVRDLRLVDTKQKLVDVSKIPGIVSKALCSAFYYEDWDRHKDNFGISYAEKRGLGVASLDYDKSLSGTFHQDNKCYDWAITPRKLRDFPVFNCWYWPTTSNKMRGFFASVFTPVKTPKMYSAEEAKQYSSLKDDPGFQQKSHVEWLKLIFIPLEVRQLAARKLACPNCDSRLKEIPKTLEERRKSLLDAAVQLNSFREAVQNNPLLPILKIVKEELKANLSKEEFSLVMRQWPETLKDIQAKIKTIENCELIAKKLGSNKLLEAIKRTGISFSSVETEEDFKARLEDVLNRGQSTKTIRNRLNKEFGLDVSEADARAIKQEAYLNMIYKFAPGLVVMLKEKLQEKGIENLRIKSSPSLAREATLNRIREFEKLLKVNKNHEIDLDRALGCFRKLGVGSSIFSDSDFKKLIGGGPRWRISVWTKRANNDAKLAVTSGREK
ncbi:MAG: hypothetical protein ACD_21C00082G0007 [uncultured bacterium]|nr:MAG: hypothetical protein ACD_21C00082G0007 [uncultured bacterium]